MLKRISDLPAATSVGAGDLLLLVQGGTAKRVTAEVLGVVRPGTIETFAAGSVPAGRLECDGSAVPRSTFAALFAAIGTTWGAGDGTTTFTLPHFRRRTIPVPAGTATIAAGAPQPDGGADIPVTVPVATIVTTIKT